MLIKVSQLVKFYNFFIMIYIGSDHLGYEWKQQVKDYLEKKGEKVVDLGVFDIAEQADYPDIAREVSEKVAENEGAMGVLIDATGVGMMIAANKVPTVRATVATSEKMARIARECSDANVVCLGTQVMPLELVNPVLDTFLETKFEPCDRDKRCVEKLECANPSA